MAHAVTGEAGAVTWGGGAVNGKFQEWRAGFEGNTANDRGAGEGWRSQVPTWSSWRVTFRYFALDQADWSLSSAASEATLINTTTTISLKRKSGDTNSWFTSTGLTKEINRVHGLEESSAFDVVVECSEGVAPTIDTTPAT